MEALVKSVRESFRLDALKKEGLPVNIWGLTRCSRPLFMEVFIALIAALLIMALILTTWTN